MVTSCFRCYDVNVQVRRGIYIADRKQFRKCLKNSFLSVTCPSLYNLLRAPGHILYFVSSCITILIIITIFITFHT